MSIKLSDLPPTLRKRVGRQAASQFPNPWPSLPPGKKTVKPKKHAKVEGEFLLAWRVMDGPPLEAEHCFHPCRKWRFDYAHPNTKVAVEIEGAIFARGGHSRGVGYREDCEKYNAATAAGWKVFRLTDGMHAMGQVTAIITAIVEKMEILETFRVRP